MHADTSIRYINLLWLIPLWIFVQYPIVFGFYYLKFSFKFISAIFGFALQLGLIGLILLFVPFIGWIILAFWYLNRPKPPKPSRSEHSARKIFKPWFIGVLKNKIG